MGDVQVAAPIRTIHPEALLKLDMVRQITGLSAPTIYRKMANGTFPLAKQISERAVAWPAERVFEWMKNLPDAEIRAAMR